MPVIYGFNGILVFVKTHFELSPTSKYAPHFMISKDELKIKKYVLRKSELKIK